MNCSSKIRKIFDCSQLISNISLIMQVKILIIILFFIEIIHAQPNWITDEGRNKYYSEDNYFISFTSQSIQKDEDLSKIQEDLILNCKKILCEKTLSKIISNNWYEAKKRNSKLDISVELMISSYSELDIKELSRDFYYDKKNKVVYSIVYAPKSENYEMWKNLLKINCIELNRICKELSLPLSPNNELYLSAKNISEKAKYYFYIIVAVFKEIKEKDIIDLFESSQNNLDKIKKFVDLPIWFQYFNYSDSIISITNLLKSYNSDAYIHFKVNLKSEGFLNVFFTNNSRTEKILNLYPNFKHPQIFQTYEKLKANSEIKFPYGLDETTTEPGKYGYGKFDEKQKCAIIFFYSSIEIPDKVAKSNNIEELKANWESFIKRNPNQLNEIHIEEIEF